jgi:hypothetical protein
MKICSYTPLILLPLFAVFAPTASPQQQTLSNPCPMIPTTPGTSGHPHPQPRPAQSTVTVSMVGGVSVAKVVTGTGCFAEQDPFLNPPGANFLPNVYTNAFDGRGVEMPNTLPSTPNIPYNLHDGDPIITAINPRSPTDDLEEAFELIAAKFAQTRSSPSDDAFVARQLQRAIDILEGNPLANRAYSGLPVLHYKGPEKRKAVQAIRDTNNNVIGGNVDIHQVWFDTHIESDTAFIDPTAVANVPWTITYSVDVLNRGHDDFSPYVMYFDDPSLSAPNPPMPHIAMDQSYFNMEEGTRTVFKIKMAPGKYYNLTYTWGWRMHPPRVQVSENATKRVPPNPSGKTLVEWEQSVFGTNPSANKDAAIAKIGDKAPEKIMWTKFKGARDGINGADPDKRSKVQKDIGDAREAYLDWRDRTRLPSDPTIKADPDSDLTLLYANNTIYAEFSDGRRMDFPKWSHRGTTLRISLYNADYFEHGYQNVDFGGARGWENQFKSSAKLGGSGCWFTFGRDHWWINIPMTSGGQPFMVMVPPANPTTGALGRYKVEITYNYDPSRRLRFYQFDPIHHDVAVFSIH